MMIAKRINKKDLVQTSLLIMIVLTLIVLGTSIDLLYVKMAILLIAIYIISLFVKGDTLLFSLLIVAYLLGSSHATMWMPFFKWSSIYYMFAVLIAVVNVFSLVRKQHIGNVFSDKYLYLLILILCWGVLSALTSTQQVQSIKNITSTFLAFVIFYLIPRYFYSFDKQVYHFRVLTITANAFMTMLCFANILHLYGLFNVTLVYQYWTSRASIYLNSNSFGANIMITIMLMNLSLITDDVFRYKYQHSISIKIYIITSYLLLLLNLLISSSRSAMLAIAVAVAPICIINIKKTIAIVPLLSVCMWLNQDSFLFLKKFQGNLLSGRVKIWCYVLNEVIAKYPILGIGSGASQDYLSYVFGGLSAHNSYLDILMSQGFVGFLLWLIVIVLVFQKALFKEKNKLIYISIVLGLMAYSLFEIGLFRGMGLSMSVFWSFVLMIEVASKERCSKVSIGKLLI